MTRINLIPPQQLHPKHLMGEYFELPRVFTGVRKAIAKGRKPSDYEHLIDFRMGAGHVTFFYTRLGFLMSRFKHLVVELHSRNVRVERLSIADPNIPLEWYRPWTPSEAEIEISRQRINARLLTMKDGERWMS